MQCSLRMINSVLSSKSSATISTTSAIALATTNVLYINNVSGEAVICGAIAGSFLGVIVGLFVSDVCTGPVRSYYTVLMASVSAYVVCKHIKMALKSKSQ